MILVGVGTHKKNSTTYPKSNFGWYGPPTYTIPTLKIDISDHPFIKDDIFEVKFNLPSIGNPVGIVAQYCKHHNMSYISQSTNKIPCNHTLKDRNRTNVCIIGIDRKESTTAQEFLEAV